MAKVVFDAPDRWVVSQELNDMYDEENELVTGKVEETVVTPDGESDVGAVLLSFFPEYAPAELGSAVDHAYENLSNYMSEYFPEFYRLFYQDQFLRHVELENGKEAWYFVSQEPGMEEVPVEVYIDIPCPLFAQPANHIVIGTIMLKTAATDVDSIVEDVVARVSVS
jgi:hypothetical protein